MASKKENIKSLFSNTRSRVIIIFTAILLITAVVIGIGKFRKASSIDEGGSAVTGAPSIQSIPGALNPTAQYAKLQESQNLDQASSALNTGGSAIPTIIRTQSLGSGAKPIGMQSGGVGFAALAMEGEGGAQRSLWLQSLKDNDCNKATVAQVLSQGGTLTDLKAGCSCTQLKDNGYQVKELQNICSCKELKSSGFNARQLKDNGFTAGRLRICGFDACELRNAGFSAQNMKDAGFSDGELKGAGFSADDILKASGIPANMSEDDIRKAGCQVDNLRRLRASGVSAAAIRRISGCSAAQLKAAGFSAADLKNAGFSAADLKNAGFSLADLKNAGFTPRDLLNAGFGTGELRAAGFGAGEIASAEAELPPGISPGDVKAAGCDVETLKKERLAGVSAKLIKQYAGCSDSALRDAGFSDQDLGLNPNQLSALNDISDAAIRAAGCDSDKLKALLAKGISVEKIHTLNGCTAAQLLAAGASPEDVRKATAISDDEIKKAGCDPVKLIYLRSQGISAKRIAALNGCSMDALKAAGFDAKSLSQAGATPEALLAAGFTPQALGQAGIKAAEVIAAGRTADCSVSSLKAARAAGVSATTIKQTLGCSAAAMRAAGYTAAELKDAGYTAAELKNAGFSAADLKAAGFSAKELADSGFSEAELKNAGFTAAELGEESEPKSNVAALAKPAVQKPATSSLNAIPKMPGQNNEAANNTAAQNAQQLQAILNKQNSQMADQRYQQKIQQRISQMLGTANDALQEWQKVTTQAYLEGNEDKKASGAKGEKVFGEGPNMPPTNTKMSNNNFDGGIQQRSMIKTGDVLFAVMDTSVNSDEPGPILATIVTGKLKGAKLIGSFTLPNQAEKMVISFNTMSVPGAPKTISISAYAIDPNTARTALSSNTDHHYLLRYGSLYASAFLEGFGNAFQSANTTVTVGGTGGGNNITVQNGIGRSVLENAVIGLATVGKNWGQVAKKVFNTPITVQVYSGTAIGVLFVQDVTAI